RLFISAAPVTKGLLPLSHNTPRRWIDEEFNKYKETIRYILSQAKSDINLSYDSWTSDSGLPLLGIVAHFIDKNCRLKTIVLGMPLLLGAHSGENIAGLVKNVIKDYRVGSKIGYFVMDNASNNDTSLQVLSKEFNIDVKKQRLRCSGHIINLVCKAIILGTDSDCFEDGLLQLVDGDIIEQIVDEFEQVIQSADEIKKVEWWRKKGPIGKLHNLVVHIMWTSQRRQLFRSKQQDLQATKLLLLTVNGGIRWNSTHDMIERALQLKDAIDLYVNHAKQVLETADIVRDELTLEDWQELTELRDLLQPMKETTKRLEGNAHTGAYGALWESLGALDFLLDHLEMEKARLEHLPSSHFKACVNLGWKKLNYYYSLSDQTPAYRAAIVLHPRFKWRWFKKHWEKSHPEWIEEARKASQKERSNFTTYMDLDDEDDSLEEDDEFERFCSLKTVR
ncbi:hypothetical protein B0A49_13726, partial [Cryomyces minteri]